jgi:NAD(P)H-hydrate epimerase
MMIGAAALAGRGALRAGAGLCRLVMPGPVLAAGLTVLPSATGVSLAVDERGAIIGHEAAAVADRVLAESSAVVVGPGLGRGAGVEALVLRLIGQKTVGVVVDADGLTAMAGIPEVWRDFHAPAVLTPHPGEFKRLAEAMKITLDPTDKATRPAAAAGLAQRLGCVVVLKGEGTIVSDGVRTWRCQRGHPCLATAGTGDVLAGVIAGLMAQHYDATRALAAAKLASLKPELAAKIDTGVSLYDLTRIGVEAHARAGEAWATAHGEAGLLAAELADLVPGVLRLDERRG